MAPDPQREVLNDRLANAVRGPEFDPEGLPEAARRAVPVRTPVPCRPTWKLNPTTASFAGRSGEDLEGGRARGTEDHRLGVGPGDRSCARATFGCGARSSA